MVIWFGQRSDLFYLLAEKNKFSKTKIVTGTFHAFRTIKVATDSMVASYILQLLSFDEVNVWIFEKEKKIH
jgi:hypothetical protein